MFLWSTRGSIASHEELKLSLLLAIVFEVILQMRAHSLHDVFKLGWLA